MSHRLIIGIGHPHRGDDAAGLEVARRLRQQGPPGARIVETTGDATTLMATWRGYDDVAVVDAMVAGGKVGDVSRVKPEDTSLDRSVLRQSSHSFGLAEAIALDRQLGSLPEHLVIYGIEGRQFDVGAEMSPEVRAAVLHLANQLSRPRSAAKGE